MECSESVKKVSFVLHHTHTSTTIQKQEEMHYVLEILTDVTPGTEAATTKAAKAKN